MCSCLRVVRSLLGKAAIEEGAASELTALHVAVRARKDFGVIVEPVAVEHVAVVRLVGALSATRSAV